MPSPALSHAARHACTTRPRWLRRLAFPGSLILAFGCMTVAVTALSGAVANAGTVPPAPSGWTTVFSDDSAGPAGSAPSSQNWFYDIGTGYGTGEIENTTSSTSNVYLDGNGDLDITATESSNGTWTSGRIDSTRDDFEAPPCGVPERDIGG